MRKISDILTVVLLVVFFSSCKKNTTNEINQEVPLTFSAYAQSVGSSEVSSFVQGDALGVYMINVSEVSEFSNFRAKNIGYTMDATSWVPVESNKMLRWSKGEPNVWLYSYSPLATPGSPIEIAQLPLGNSADTAINYTLPLDQSVQTATQQKKCDLLRSVSKGEGDNGWTIENSPLALPLNHQHMLTKVLFNIYVANYDASPLNNKAHIKSVRIVSKDIAQSGVMSIKDGSVTKVNPTDKLIWRWDGDVEVDVHNYNASSPVLFPVDFIVSPFSASLEGTVFEFDVQYSNVSGRPIDVRTSYTCPDAGVVKFVQGKKTVFKTKIVLSDNEVFLDHSVVNWDEDETFIGPSEEL